MRLTSISSRQFMNYIKRLENQEEGIYLEESKNSNNWPSVGRGGSPIESEMKYIVWSGLRKISGWSAKEGRRQLRIRQNLSPSSSKVMEWAVVDLLPPPKSVAGHLIWLFTLSKVRAWTHAEPCNPTIFWVMLNSQHGQTYSQRRSVLGIVVQPPLGVAKSSPLIKLQEPIFIFRLSLHVAKDLGS